MRRGSVCGERPGDSDAPRMKRRVRAGERGVEAPPPLDSGHLLSSRKAPRLTNQKLEKNRQNAFFMRSKKSTRHSHPALHAEAPKLVSLLPVVSPCSPCLFVPRASELKLETFSYSSPNLANGQPTRLFLAAIEPACSTTEAQARAYLLRALPSSVKPPSAPFVAVAPSRSSAAPLLLPTAAGSARARLDAPCSC